MHPTLTVKLSSRIGRTDTKKPVFSIVLPIVAQDVLNATYLALVKLVTGVRGINQLTSGYSCLSNLSTLISFLILSNHFYMDITTFIVVSHHSKSEIED